MRADRIVNGYRRFVQTTPEGSCVVCGGELRAFRDARIRRCVSCSSWRSNLPVTIDIAGGSTRSLDERVRRDALEPLRRANFAQVLDRLEQRAPMEDKDVLDVGSAHGWFLEAAADRGARPVGVEPDSVIAAAGRDDGLAVRAGFFPDVIAEGEQFDVITFNDVLEHIPDVAACLDACHDTLRPGGLLSINIPTSDGLAYRLAVVLARCGVRAPFDRLWQVGLPSPHRHYFPRLALARLVETHGFVGVQTKALPAIRLRGLWGRLHMISRPSAASVLLFGALVLASPLLNRPRNSDIVHVVALRD